MRSVESGKLLQDSSHSDEAAESGGQGGNMAPALHIASGPLGMARVPWDIRAHYASTRTCTHMTRAVGRMLPCEWRFEMTTVNQASNTNG